MKEVIKMTVKTELERLKKKKEELEKDKRMLEKALDELISQKTALQRKEEELSQRKSPLAHTLQAQNQKKLDEVLEKIVVKSLENARVEKELQEIQEGIDARENDTTLYIQEQVQLMVPQFLEWVVKNKAAIGYDITRSFYIAGVVAWNRAFDVDCYTGDVGIFDKGDYPAVETIICSENFYFKQLRYQAEEGDNGWTIKKTIGMLSIWMTLQRLFWRNWRHPTTWAKN